MNIRLLLLLTALVVHSIHTARASEVPVPHLDLEMTSAEYAPYLKKAGKQADEPPIAEALQLGQRLANWIKFENEKRPADRQIRLTSSGTRAGIPIETPSQYNPSIVKTRLDNVLAEMPEGMKAVLTTRLPYPDQLPVDDETFVLLGRKLDRVYQTAARWKTLKPYMSYYIRYQSRDVRGYYFLKKENWTAERLSGFATLDSETQKQVKGWLFLLCLNSGSADSYCNSALQQAVQRKQVAEFYSRYITQAERNWDSFFKIPVQGVRSDIIWNSSNPQEAVIPFITPSSARIQTYLSENIEDEWKWEGWNLRLKFGPYTDAPRIVFETGVVPHVNGLGGNEITMDENQSVEEYESKWTIRHEFGHVLGFPDCYHEFYDSETQSFINYQLDVTDLMCSRAGNMNQRLFDEMKRAYFKP